MSILYEEYQELEKFLKEKGYTPNVRRIDGKVIFTKMKSQHKGDSIKLRMIVSVSFGAVIIKEEK